jgi:hypothetical protein
LQLSELQELFHLPLSEEAYTQLCDLDIYLQALQTKMMLISGNIYGEVVSTEQPKLTKHLIGSQPIHPTFQWLWYSSCQQRYKMHKFACMALHALPTRTLRSRSVNLSDSSLRYASSIVAAHGAAH